MAPSIVPWILILFLHNFIKGVVMIASGNAENDIDFTTMQISMKDVLAGVANSTLDEIVAEGDRLWDQELEDQLKTSTVPEFNTTYLDVLLNETLPIRPIEAESTLTDSTTKAIFRLWLNSSTSVLPHNATEVSQFVNSSLDISKSEMYTTSSPSFADTSSRSSEDSTTSALQHATLYNDTTAANSRNTSIISDTTYSDKRIPNDTVGNMIEASTETVVTNPGRPIVRDSGQKNGTHSPPKSRIVTEDVPRGNSHLTMYMVALVISIMVVVVLLVSSAYVCCKVRKCYMRQMHTAHQSREKYCMHNMAFDIHIESSNNNSVKTDDIIVES